LQSSGTSHPPQLVQSAGLSEPSHENTKGKKVLLLSECPFTNCLASFPDDYKSLRLHLATEHFRPDLEAALHRCYNRKHLLSEDCINCGARLAPGDESSRMHYYLQHGLLDRELMNFFSRRLKPVLSVCPQAGCQFSSRSYHVLLREVPSIYLRN
jgi:hypothetical protein